MKKLSLEDFLKLRRLVCRGARPLDFTKWKYLFENGSCEDFLSVLSAYQNEDGGFGYNIECNNWNPDSSPYTVCIALDYLDAAGDYVSNIKNEMVAGIIKYLASATYFTENGWVGMQGIPGNNDYSHLPWFHYDPKKAAEADIGVTKRLSDFILKYADKNSEIRQKAAALKDKYKQCGKILLNGVPDYDLTAFDPEAFDPETWPMWQPLPVFFVGSPESGHYPALKNVADINLDTIVDTLRDTREIYIASEKEIKSWEKNNAHPDGRRKRWSGAEQAIGNYYWGAHGITSNMDILRKFDRLDFPLPVSIE
ncbi:MAG: hypothetical protein FWF08_02485 [Oscillospiraceae bacterium]|nr:hypothetical protein [Oscillospiraceae bacterium]